MRNKLFVLWIVFLSLLPTCVLSEEQTQEQAAQSFVFRNGITWDSTKEEIIASDLTLPEEDTFDTWSALLYSDVSVSNYTANGLAYAFTNDQLLCIFYYFESFPPASQEYLISALESKYGTPISPDTKHLLRLTNLMDPDAFRESDISDVHNWHLEDGTCIAYLKAVGESYLFYFNEEAMLQTYGIFNTFGL